MTTKLSRNEVLKTWKNIDRKMKRVLPADDELTGLKDHFFEPAELTPLQINTNNNSLGGLSARHLAGLMDNWEQEQLDKIQRYEKLKSAQEHPEIDGALNIYADEACTDDKSGVIVHVQHPEEKVRNIIEEMMDRVGLEDHAWHIIRGICGFGDFYKEVVISQDGKRVLKLETIPRKSVIRVEENNKLKGFQVNKDLLDSDDNFSYQFHFKTQQEKDDELMFPFRVLHFRLNPHKYGVYGQSVIDTIVSVIEQLKMMEKALLIARVTRAPERRVYNIDVGNLMGTKAIRYAQEVVEHFKNKKVFYNSNTDLQKDIFGTVEDLVVPKRAGSEGNSITTLEQAVNLGDIGDIEYLRDKIFPPLGIPRQYLFDDTFAAANVNLSSKSIPFAKRIKRVQKQFLKQIYKLCTIELKLQGFSNDTISKLTLLMNNPSNLDDRDRIDVETQRWTLISTIKSLNTEGIFFPDYLIYKEFLQMDDVQIVNLLKLAELQAAGLNAFEALDENDRPAGAEDLGAYAAPPAAGEDGEELIGGGGGALPAPGEGEIPDEVEAALGPAPEPENADFILDTDGKIPVMEDIKRKALRMKQNVIRSAQKTIAEAAQRNSKSMEEARKYERAMRITRKSAFNELDADGQLDGLDVAFELDNRFYLD